MMFILLIISAALLIISILSTGSEAITITVNSDTSLNLSCNQTLIIDQGQAAPSIACAMQFAQDNDTVFLLGGTYTGKENSNICADQCNVTNVKLIGSARSTIVCPKLPPSRAIIVDRSSFSLIANITFENCNFISAGGADDDALVTEYAGGAIILRYSNTVLKNLVFFNNSAESGGALSIATSSNATIIGCNFFNNRAYRRGGAISVLSSSVVISNSIFSRNTASSFLTNGAFGLGGGIFFSARPTADDAPFIKLIDSHIEANYAAVLGGGVFIESLSSREANFEARNSHFLNNSVIGLGRCVTSNCYLRGGGVYMSVVAAKIEFCTFANNYAIVLDSSQIAQGGALFSKGYTAFGNPKGLYINGTDFIGNNVTNAGGAVYIYNQVSNMENSNFLNNSCGNPVSVFVDATTFGGAVVVSSGSAIATFYLVNFKYNVVFGGWGGGLFVYSNAIVKTCSFIENVALSSYSFNSKGGAIMAGVGSVVSIYDSSFLSNLCSARTDLDPFTLSGTGGAIFAQSQTINVTSSVFKDNLAMSGQFDVGSIGGAILLENVVESFVLDSYFFRNGAVGYSISNFAAAGSGGAIALKFTGKISIINCDFDFNWVTSDGKEESLGGAMVAFFDSSEDFKQLVMISDSRFSNNSALGQPCFQTWSGAGSGGAVAIVGVSKGFSIVNTNFTGNLAFSPPSDLVISTGGAISMSLSSNLSMADCVFKANQALNGEGNDVASFSGNPSNALLIKQSTFNALGKVYEQQNSINLAYLALYICTISRQTNQKSPYFKYDYSVDQESSSKKIKKVGVMKARVTQKLNTYKSRILDESLAESDTNDAHLESLARTQEHLDFLDKYERFLASWSSESVSSDSARARYLGFDIISVNETFSRWEKPLLPFVEPLFESNSSSLSRRKLGSFFSIKALNPVSPGILVADGTATIYNPKFYGNYFIFIGNIGQILPLRYRNGFSGACSGHLYGTILYGTPSASLSVAILDSILLLVNSKKGIDLTDISLVNSTLKISNNIQVFGNATLVAATIVNAGGSQIVAPSITFLSTIYTGFSSSSTQIYTFQVDDDNVPNFKYVPFITLNKVNMSIQGTMHISSTISGMDTTGQNVLDISLHDKSNFLISNTGTLLVESPTTIYSDSTSSVVNNGTIRLLGNPFDMVIISDSGASLIPKRPVSLQSPLKIQGSFEQTKTASMYIILNTSFETVPVLHLQSNATLLGQLYFNFTSSSLGPDLSTFGSDPSQWSLIYFDEVGVNPEGVATLNGPPGLKFESDISYEQSNLISYYEEKVQVSNIACSQLLYYYKNLEGGQCQVCLQNSSCSYCSSSSGMQSSAAIGACVDTGDTCPAGESHRFHSSCCIDDCTSPNGECKFDSTNLQFYCHCNTWYSEGGSCNQLSTTATVLIAAAVFFTVVSVLTLLYYRYSRNTKNRVLDELTQGLLNNNDMGTFQENQQANYISAMQQALILKDVFVKFEDIKMEGKIGEGSFGVVYKAMFRGAQVAVKQMRSMYLELTEADIAEFKKEAYMMSRLRHPNIVLVMGISFIEQEAPMIPPKKRFNTVENDPENIEKEKEKEKEKAKSRPKTICIITEYLEQGSLADILYGPTRLPAEVWNYELILTLALQAARGMLYLHSNSPPICHRDLKSSNLVVDDHFVVKVTDFGMSRIVPEKLQDQDKGIGTDGPESIETSRGSVATPDNEISLSKHDSTSSLSALLSASKDGSGKPGDSGSFNPEMTSNLGTTAWCAPELLTASSTTRYSIKVDVYSFGMVLWELWEKKRPFDDLHSRFDIIDAVRSGKRPPVSDNCPPAFRSLMQRCWQTDPTRRPTFQYICRYIKDELARAKRQKNTNPQVSYYTNTNTPIPTLYPDVLGTSIEDGSHDMIPSMRNSLSKLAHSISSNLSNSNGSSSNKTSNMDSSDGSLKPIFREGSSDGNVQMPHQNSSSIMTPFDKRAPLVNAVADGEYSDLASSPMVTNSNLANRYAPAAADSRNSRLSDSNSTGPRVPFGSTANNRTQQPSNNQPGQGQWRDRYVMKFSGWKASQPDTGLPPSLVQGGAASVSTPTSSLGSKGVASVYSPLQGARGRQSSSDYDANVNIGNININNNNTNNIVHNNSSVNEQQDSYLRSPTSNDGGIFALDEEDNRPN